MEIELLPIEKLIPYARNSRTHSDEQVAQVAASIMEFGFTNPVLIGKDNDIIAGHGRVLAAKKLALKEVPCIRLGHLTENQKRAYVIADNKLALNSGWDDELLKLELLTLKEEDFNIDLLGFNSEELDALLLVEQIEGKTDPDEVPEAPENPVTVLGDVWTLGNHRVMCGDSTMVDAVTKLMNGETAALIHADPPYGMGKQSDGVANDNIYEENLDKFQMDWWVVFRMFTASNGSAYIWGNAPDLWRLWYRGGLADSEYFEFRNQIVWDKKAIPGMKSEALTQYPIATEHCLFFQFGNQYLSSTNINAEDFPSVWEPLRLYMEEQANRAGIGAKEIKLICGCQMYGHWFTRSQFTLMPEKHYATLAAAYPGCFVRPWISLKEEWDQVGIALINRELRERRSYFDNAHDIMRDVWDFSRVTGADRHGHATPKPVAMMERVMKSSLPTGGICAEPFGGSGSTLIGAEKTGRICYTMELQPQYCDVIVKRWQEFTGKTATHAETGKTFNEMLAAK